MEQPFIYKYQPLFLKDFEADEELIIMIKTLIQMNSLNILFIGDSGCGKSSFIQSIVREYYNNYSNYSENVLIINNLKEQGISYYRNDVKTFCQTSCSIPSKKKFLILDDIDLIHEHSQQVFRNCIDKYSDNIHFIASCSNTQKVIESLQSRLNIIKIKPYEKHHLVKIMKKIAKIENIELSTEIEDFIISISNYSIRILINYLEKIKLYNKPISIEIISKLCTNIPFHDFNNYTILCKSKNNLNNAIHILYNLFHSGYSVMDILDNYFLFIKSTTILNETEKYKIMPLLCKYITYFYQIHEDVIELAFFTNNLIKLLN